MTTKAANNSLFLWVGILNGGYTDGIAGAVAMNKAEAIKKILFRFDNDQILKQQAEEYWENLKISDFQTVEAIEKSIGRPYEELLEECPTKVFSLGTCSIENRQELEMVLQTNNFMVIPLDSPYCSFYQGGGT